MIKRDQMRLRMGTRESSARRVNRDMISEMILPTASRDPISGSRKLEQNRVTFSNGNSDLRFLRFGRAI
jgi:hypothetical protein